MLRKITKMLGNLEIKIILELVRFILASVNATSTIRAPLSLSKSMFARYRPLGTELVAGSRLLGLGVANEGAI